MRNTVNALAVHVMTMMRVALMTLDHVADLAIPLHAADLFFIIGFVRFAGDLLRRFGRARDRPNPQLRERPRLQMLS